MQLQEPGPPIRALKRVIVLLLKQFQLHRDLVCCELGVKNGLHLRGQLGARKPAFIKQKLGCVYVNLLFTGNFIVQNNDLTMEAK